MKKLLSLLLLPLVCITGCDNLRNNKILSPQEQARKDSLALKVALMPTLDCLPFYYAETMGFYDELGLDIRLHTYMAQMDVDTAFSRQHVEICYTDLIRAVLLHEQGDSLYVIMKANGGHRLVTARNKRIRTPKQLKERMVAVARHSVTDFYSDAVMDSAGLEQTAIYRPQVNDIRLRGDMLRNGTMDAAFLPEPYATQAVAEGNRCIFGQAIANKPQLMALIMNANAHGDKNRKRQTELLLEGYNRAADELNRGGQPDSLRLIWTRIYRLSAQAADSLRLPHFPKAAPQQHENIQAAVRWLQSRNLLPEEYRTDTLISNLFPRK